MQRRADRNVTLTAVLITAAHTDTRAGIKSMLVTDSKIRIKRRQTVYKETQQLSSRRCHRTAVNFLALRANVSQQQTAVHRLRVKLSPPVLVEE